MLTKRFGPWPASAFLCLARHKFKSGLERVDFYFVAALWNETPVRIGLVMPLEQTTPRIPDIAGGTSSKKKYGTIVELKQDGI